MADLHDDDDIEVLKKQHPEHAAYLGELLMTVAREEAQRAKQRARYKQRFPEGKSYGKSRIWWTDKRLAEVLTLYVQLRRQVDLAKHHDLSKERMRQVIHKAIRRELERAGCNNPGEAYDLTRVQMKQIKQHGKKLTFRQLRSLVNG